MNPNLPPSLGSIPSFFRHPLALLGGLILCLTSAAASAQSVTFAGAQTTLPASGLNVPYGVAVDSAGNVFIGDTGNSRVLELPWDGDGYGQQATLPFSGLASPGYVAVDSAGDVFVSGGFPTGYLQASELPWTGSGYGQQTQTTLASSNGPGLTGVAMDNAGDVFAAYNNNPDFTYSSGSVVEWPWSATGYGSPTVPPITVQAGMGTYFNQLAVDGAGDIFVNATQYYDDGEGFEVVEAPKTGTGYGQTIGLSVGCVFFECPGLIGADGAGDLFLINGINLHILVQELPWTGTAYGPLITVPISGWSSLGEVAKDSQGDLFISDGGNNRVVELQTISVTFGPANVCAPGATTPAPCSQTLTLNFNVNADATLGTPEVLTGGITHRDFVRASGSTCTGAVTAGSTCTVNVTFAPLAAGFRHGSVDITDGSGNFIATTQLSGFGVAATTGSPVVQLSTNYLPFGSIAFGSGATKTLPLMVANIGGGTLTVAPSIGGHSYSIARSTCAAGVTPGNSCTLAVQFSATSIATTHDDVLTVNTNGGNPTVNLAGSATGLSVLGGVSGASLDFGTVDSGSTEVRSLTVTNVGLPGTVAVGTTAAGHAFTILTTSENTCLAGIAAGQSCSLPVEFAPTLSGIHNDLLTLTPSPGRGETTVWLVGTTP